MKKVLFLFSILLALNCSAQSLKSIPVSAIDVSKWTFYNVTSVYCPSDTSGRVKISVADKYSPVHAYIFYFTGIPTYAGCGDISSFGIPVWGHGRDAYLEIFPSNCPLASCWHLGGSYGVQVAPIDANGNAEVKSAVKSFTITK